MSPLRLSDLVPRKWPVVSLGDTDSVPRQTELMLKNRVDRDIEQKLLRYVLSPAK
jgi:hypothetical protein